MLLWLQDLLYGSRPARFTSSFGLDDSVTRLRAATVRNAFSALMQQQAVGRVTPDKVSLYRVIPFVHNSFVPVFSGRFDEQGGHVVLAGRFAMPLATRIGMTVWLGFVALWTLIALIAVAIQRDGRQIWFTPLAGVAMFAFGVALVRFGKWWARNDEAWLSQRIAAALGGSSPAAPRPIG